ncbi:hypothetical protein PflCFBP13517_12280 [Pseudomonas fluorescens]|nr:hypothetical protein PflCFBP13517_12280 [Pseudomonas fluorescens]
MLLDLVIIRFSANVSLKAAAQHLSLPCTCLILILSGQIKCMSVTFLHILIMTAKVTPAVNFVKL